VSDRTAHAGEGSYLAIFRNKVETSGDRFERTEGICGVSRPKEEQFGRGRRSRLLGRLGFIRGSARFTAHMRFSAGREPAESTLSPQMLAPVLLGSVAPREPMLGFLLQPREQTSKLHVDIGSAQMVVR